MATARRSPGDHFGEKTITANTEREFRCIFTPAARHSSAPFLVLPGHKTKAERGFFQPSTFGTELLHLPLHTPKKKQPAVEEGRARKQPQTPAARGASALGCSEISPSQMRISTCPFQAQQQTIGELDGCTVNTETNLIANGLQRTYSHPAAKHHCRGMLFFPQCTTSYHTPTQS